MPSDWGMRAMALNAHRGPSQPASSCSIPVRIRIEWRVGGERWCDGVATGWVGHIVRVRLAEPAGTVWVHVDDVRRR